MTHLIVLLMVIAVGASAGGPADLSWAPAWLRGGVDALRAHAVLVTLAGFAVVVCAQGIAAFFFEKRLSASGRAFWVRTADRALLAAQWAGAIWLALACHVLGFVEAIRARTGDVVLLDELIALLPAVATFGALWLFFWPVERRLREAAHFGRLERGDPVHDIPGRLRYTSDQLRTHVGPPFVAALLLFGWIETVDRGARAFHGRLGDNTDAVATAVLVVGAIAIVGVLPLLWRLLWRTRRLPPGALRDELHALCARHRVRVADLLIWETRGALLNGALVGVLPRLRYIMLTDALLERLTAREVEAVMAHEIAHARHRHIPWLIGAILVVVGLSSAVASLVLARETGLSEAVSNTIAGGVAIVAALLVLGWVSRRFEEQADAFAAAHLALVRTDEDDPAIEQGDAAGMAHALGAVARHNHIPVRKFSYRHGSIRSRQDRLMRLVGTRTSRLPIDGGVRRLKRTVLLAAVTLAVLLWRFPQAGALL